MKKILIYGIGSLQNRGCEALVNSSISQIDPKVEIVAATFDYENDKDMYPQRIKYFVDHHKQDESKFTKEEQEEYDYIKSLPFDYNNYELFYERDVVHEMQDADLCIHIGGDNYCYGVNEWMYAINNKAQELNKKTVLWGASLFDEIKDLELIDDLKKYDLLMLREKISYNAIKKYIPEEKLMLVPDPAFSLKPKKVALDSWYKNKKIIGINLSPLTIKTEENENAVSNFIDDILAKTDYHIALLPHVTVSEVNDLNTLRKIKEKYKEDERVFLEEKEYNCQELKYIISKCDLLIAARTHASIAAYSSSVPTLVIGYSVKSRGIAESLFGNYQEYVLPADELKGNALIEKFSFIEKNKDKIKKVLEKEMKHIKEEAGSLYSKMLERLQLIDESRVCSNEKCTGCSACLNICPVGAITMKENEEGFLYPKIDLDKCIHCDMCRKHCCAIKQNEKKEREENNVACYAAKAVDEKVKKNSTSGGIFHFLASEILSRKGIVYGAELNNYEVQHIRISAKKDLAKIRGSKYAQSSLATIFKQVKKDLEAQKEVLFSGTPCQILGLKNYLEKEYDNLYTVSVICHGVINNNLLKKRIREFEKQYETTMKNVKYRSKINGWDKSTIEFDSERICKSYDFTEDPLMALYINNFILRESCYQCPAKGLANNVADIVLGDYWGIYHVKREFFDNQGVSAVIIKTKKGKELYNKIAKNIISEATEYDDFIKYNSSFAESPKRPLLRNRAFIDIKSNELSLVAENYSQKLKEAELNSDKARNLESENLRLQEQLKQIYNSKRFKMVDRLGNMVNKIIRRK